MISLSLSICLREDGVESRGIKGPIAEDARVNLIRNLENLVSRQADVVHELNEIAAKENETFVRFDRLVKCKLTK